MPNSPQVSVVMSIYNNADILVKTLNSILIQEDCDFEFIVVDDGSTDASGRILDDWAVRDKRLRVIHQENTGLTKALIRGCSEARGWFIARQDAGDISLPGRLSRELTLLQNNTELSFVSCYTQYVGPLDEFLYFQQGNGLALKPLNIIDAMQLHGVKDGPSHHGSVMFRRDSYIAVGGYREEFYFGQDWDLWYRLADIGKFQMLDAVLYQARIGLNDISTNNKKLQEQLAKISRQCLALRIQGKTEGELLKAASEIRPCPKKSSSRSNISRGCYFLGECLRNNGAIDSARAYFRRAISNNPMNYKAWLRLLQTQLKF